MSLRSTRAALLITLLLALVASFDLPRALANGPKGPGNATALERIEVDYKEGKLTFDQYTLFKVYFALRPEKLASTPYAVLPGEAYGHATEITTLLLSTKANWDRLGAETRKELGFLWLRAVDPGGGWDGQQHLLPQITETDHFALHWTTGADNGLVGDRIALDDLDLNGIPDYIDNFGIYFETAWTDIVQSRQYRAPVNDVNRPQNNPVVRNNPNEKIDVFIYNMPQGAYGYSDIDQQVPDPNRRHYTGHINADNDFSGAVYLANQLYCMKFTAAHELFHLVQYAYDPNEEFWWMEATAVFMADEVFPEANVHYEFIPRWFDTADVFGLPSSVSGQSGSAGWHWYGDFIWAERLSRDFPGVDIIKEIWNSMDTVVNSPPQREPAFQTINSVLQARNSGVTAEFVKFARANYFLEKGAAPMYGTEGAEYRGQAGTTTDNGVFLAFNYNEASNGVPFTISTANVKKQGIPNTPPHDAKMDAYATNYVKLTMSGATPVLKISFDGAVSVPYAVSLVTLDTSGTIKVFDVPLDSNKDGTAYLPYNSSNADVVLIISNPSDTVSSSTWQVTLSAAAPQVAETDLGMNLDDLASAFTSVVKAVVKINNVKRAVEVVQMTGGLGSYDARLDYDGAGINIININGISPFDPLSSTIHNGNGTNSYATFNSSQSGATPQAPMKLATVVPKLLGSKDNLYSLRLHFDSLKSGTGEDISANEPVKTYRRGDANNDGSVTITDALFIAQYLAGLRSAGEAPDQAHPINAAGVRHDINDMDKVTIADAMFIAQMLAGLKDASYNDIPSPPPPQRSQGGASGRFTTENSTVQIGSAALPPGANAQIPITVKSVTDAAGLGAYDIKVTFNPQVVRVDNVTAGVYSEPTFGIDNTTGSVRLNAYKSDRPGPTGDVIVAYLSVTALGASGNSTPLDVSVTDLSNSYGDSITATDVDGTATINAALPAVAVNSPGGGDAGESWDVNGPNQTITWTASSASGITGVDILYSASSGADGYPYVLAQGLPNTGNFTWQAPLGTKVGQPQNILSPYMRVKVVAHGGNGNTGSDISHRNFSIVDTAALAEIDLVPELDSSGYAVVTPNVKDLKNPSTQLIENIGDGLKSYNANVTHQVTQDSAGVNIKTVAGIAPFGAPAAVLNEDIGNNQLRTSVQDSQTSSMPMLPRSVAWLRTFLLGSKDTAYTLTLNFTSMARTSGSTVPQQASKSRIFKRGDAKADGTVNIIDAMFISQYLVGSRTLGDDTGTGSYTHTHPINSAGVAHDDDTGDKITTADSLFISQMLSGLRDSYYNWIGGGLAAKQQAASTTIVVAGKTTVESGSATLATGASTRIPITVKNIGDPLGLGSYNLKLAFDSKVIRVDTIESPAFAPTVVTALDDVKAGTLAVTCANIDNKGGKVSITAFQPGIPGPTKDVVIAYVTVTAVGPSKSATPLTISSVNLTNADGKNIITLSASGSVSVN